MLVSADLIALQSEDEANWLWKEHVNAGYGGYGITSYW
jgi:hypothetical protein